MPKKITELELKALLKAADDHCEYLREAREDHIEAVLNASVRTIGEAVGELAHADVLFQEAAGNWIELHTQLARLKAKAGKVAASKSSLPVVK